MGEHSLSARMQQKIDTAANWAKATNFVPKKGEIIVYSDGGGAGIPRIKVGDGGTTVGSLAFIGNGIIPISQGGTGATTKAGAQAEIEQRGVITDANEFLDMGLAIFQPTTTNVPKTDGGYGIIDNKISLGPTQNNSDNWAYQTAYTTDKSANHDQVWIRKKINNINWTAWDPIITAKSIGSYTSGAAKKLETARNITLVSPNVDTRYAAFDGTSSVSIEIPEISSNKLSWRGTDLAGTISPVDALADGLLGGNRGAGITDPDCVLVEYSQDGGETWQEYECDPGSKIKLLYGQKDYPLFKLGGPNTDESVPFDLNHQLRITIMPKTAVYFSLHKIFILVKGAGLCQCKIEKAQGSSDISTTGYVFQDLKTTQVKGWSGWNSICLPNNLPFGDAETDSSHTVALRFTFWRTEVSTQYPNNIELICRIFLIGTTSWISKTNLGATGHLYSYDWKQNATFPAQITATKFNGPATSVSNSLTLNGTSFDGSTKVSLSSQQLGVPSAFIAKSVSVLDCNNEKIGRVLSSSSSNSLVNGPSEVGSTGAGVLWNIPALHAPTSSVNESGTWQYLHQVFITGVSGKVYLRSSASNGAANWSYGEWAKVLTDKNFASTIQLTSGGVNLLTNTKSFINGNYTIKGTLQSETYNGFAVRQGANTSDDAALIIQYIPALEANKSYTLSFWAKGSGSIQGLITGYNYPCSSISSENTSSTDEGGANTFPLTSSWKRYWITFTMGNWSSAASGKVLWLRARTQDGSGTVANVCGLKWENGNVATDWAPAPEDIQHETSSRLVLQSTAWTGSGPYSAVLSCSHITTNNTVIVSMAAPVSQVQYETFCKAQITAASQADGSITFTAYGTKPTINLPIAITTLGG